MARPENPIEYASTDQLYRGSQIRELRRKKGLSREKMAALLGCHPDSLSNVETNSVNPSQQMLEKIAKLLKVPFEHFEQKPVHPKILRKKAAQSDIHVRRMPHQKAVRHGRAVKSGAQVKPTTLPAIGSPAMDISDSLGVTGEIIEYLIASAHLSEEEEKHITGEVIEFTKRLLTLNEALRKREDV